MTKSEDGHTTLADTGSDRESVRNLSLDQATLSVVVELGVGTPNVLQCRPLSCVEGGLQIDKGEIEAAVLVILLELLEEESEASGHETSLLKIVPRYDGGENPGEKFGRDVQEGVPSVVVAQKRVTLPLLEWKYDIAVPFVRKYLH